MTLEPLLLYFDELFAEVARNYLAALERNDEDGVHDLRVALKRMKALFNLVGAMDHEFPIKERFKPFRRLAKNTAGLRDAQVQRRLIADTAGDKGASFPEFDVWIEDREREGAARFREFAATSPLPRLESRRRHIERMVRSVSPVAAATMAQGRFYNLRNDMIFLSQNTAPDENALHRFRILAKETHYTLETVRRCFGMFPDAEQIVERIKQMHKLLGAIHDRDIALNWIDLYRASADHGSERLGLAPLVRHIRSERRKLLRDFLRVSRDFPELAAEV